MVTLCPCPNCGKSLKWRLLLTKYGATGKKWYQFVSDTTVIPTNCCPYCEVCLEEPVLLTRVYTCLFVIWCSYKFFVGNTSFTLSENQTWQRGAIDISLVLILILTGWFVRAWIGFRKPTSKSMN